MFFVSLNHCDAIQRLVKIKNFASAFALMRPMFETTARSIWLHRCADDGQIEKIIEKDNWKNVGDLFEEVERARAWPSLLSKMWNNLRKSLHSFTHGGVQNAARQIDDDGYVTPNVNEDELVLLMRAVSLFSWVILGEMIDLSESEELMPQFIELKDSLSGWGFGIGPSSQF